MYSEDELTAAVEAGALTPEAAAALRAFVARQRATPAADEEHFRLIMSFNDVFVTIACVLLLLAVKWLSDAAAGWLGPACVAATAWLLAEFFTRKRRMALPSILLLLAFVGGVFAASLLVMGREAEQADFAIAATLAALAAWLHWWRFKVPITLAAGVGAVVVLAYALLFLAVPDAKKLSSVVSFLAGVSVFALAMWWDTKDPARETRRSDVAFWLHLLAAPLIVHPVFALLGVLDGKTGVVEAAVVVLFYVGLGVVSLLVDRRALLVSALLYVLYTLKTLFQQFDVVDHNTALSALMIGSALLLLSAFWHAARSIVVRRLPDFLSRKLPPLK